LHVVAVVDAINRVVKPPRCSVVARKLLAIEDEKSFVAVT